MICYPRILFRWRRLPRSETLTLWPAPMLAVLQGRAEGQLMSKWFGDEEQPDRPPRLPSLTNSSSSYSDGPIQVFNTSSLTTANSPKHVWLSAAESVKRPRNRAWFYCKSCLRYITSIHHAPCGVITPKCIHQLRLCLSFPRQMGRRIRAYS